MRDFTKIGEHARLIPTVKFRLPFVSTYVHIQTNTYRHVSNTTKRAGEMVVKQ